MAEGNLNGNPTPGVSGNQGNNATADITHQIINNTNVQLKYENNKIQEFFRYAGKDFITAMAFI
jgi:hypothetical protein